MTELTKLQCDGILEAFVAFQEHKSPEQLNAALKLQGFYIKYDGVTKFAENMERPYTIPIHAIDAMDSANYDLCYQGNGVFELFQDDDSLAFVLD